jgi:hypothetical protein
LRAAPAGRAAPLNEVTAGVVDLLGHKLPEGTPAGGEKAPRRR